jgi:hypothetical protein
MVVISAHKAFSLILISSAKKKSSCKRAKFEKRGKMDLLKESIEEGSKFGLCPSY